VSPLSPPRARADGRPPERSGFLVLDKPEGLRSTACVEAVRRVLGRKSRVGHSGTLDSTASGLLVLLLGEATRLSDTLMSLPKEYVAVGRFGAETETDDASGLVLREADLPKGGEEALRGILPAFLGWRMQVPPSISAVHVEGGRAHERARRGESLLLAPRPVFLEDIRLQTFDAPSGRFAIHVRCHKGTYIRSLIRDIGRVLGSAAHVVSLRRTRLGPFVESDAWRLPFLAEGGRERLAEESDPGALLDRLLPIGRLRGSLPTYVPRSEATEERMRRGERIALADLRRLESGGIAGGGRILVLGRGTTLAVPEGLQVHPRVNLAADPEGGDR